MIATPQISKFWLAVPGYEGLYEVSDIGEVRSRDRKCNGNTSGIARGKLLRGYIDRDGYRIVSLSSKGGVKQKFRAHRLVLEAFVGPCPEGCLARHLNGNPLDNWVENLAWGTPTENSADMIRHGTFRRSTRTHCLNGHELTPENTYTPPGTGKRQCRTCNREARKAEYWRKKASAMEGASR